MSHLNFPVVNLKQTIDAITKHDIRFEIYNEGDIKIDKNGTLSAARILRSHGSNTQPAICCLRFKRRRLCI